MSSRQSPSATPASPTATPFQPHRHSTSPTTKSPSATPGGGFHLLSPVSANSQIVGSQHLATGGGCGSPQRHQGGSQGKATSSPRLSPRVFRGSTSPSRLVVPTSPSRVVSQSRAEEADDGEAPHPTSISPSKSTPSALPLPTPAADIDASNRLALMRLMELDTKRMLQQHAESDDLVRRSCTVAPSQSNVVHGSQHNTNNNTPPPRGYHSGDAESASPSDAYPHHERGSIQIGRASSLMAHGGEHTTTTTPNLSQHNNSVEGHEASPLRSQQSSQAEVSEGDGDDDGSSSSSPDCIKEDVHIYSVAHSAAGGIHRAVHNPTTAKRPNEFNSIDNSIVGVGILTAAFDLLLEQDGCIHDQEEGWELSPPMDDEFVMEEMPHES